MDVEYPVSFSKTHIDAVLKILKQKDVPLTWMLYTSRRNPDRVIKYYKKNYFSQIPKNHEIGIHIHFEDEESQAMEGYPKDPEIRREIVLEAKKVFVRYDINAKSHAAGCFGLENCDLRNLEEIGILTDRSIVPNISPPCRWLLGNWVDFPFRSPYFPARDNLRLKGDSPILEVPVGSHNGSFAYIDKDYNPVPVYDYFFSNGIHYMAILCHDGWVNLESLSQTIHYWRLHDGQFVTLSELREIFCRANCSL